MGMKNLVEVAQLNEAAELYEKAAAQGDVVAMYHLARCYETGAYHSVIDLTKATEWYQKAAALGCVEAQFALNAQKKEEEA